MSCNVCGIELKAGEAIFSIVDQESISHMEVAIKKISLGDTESCADIVLFKESVEGFLSDNNISRVFIKKRATKGKFAGGSDTFKMEGLIQLIPGREISFVSPQSISAFCKKISVNYPETLKKYQYESFSAAVTGLLK